MGRFVVGVSGASGVVLARLLIQELMQQGHVVEFVMSQSAQYTASIELGKEWATANKWVQQFSSEAGQIHLHPIQDLGCAIASGSYPVDGMVIVPCSMATLAAISIGLGDNVLRRAADVTLKEKRPLILVPRECPFSELHLENLLKLSRLGATIVPPIPGWYTAPKTLEEVESFIVGKILEALRLDHQLYPRWKSYS